MERFKIRNKHNNGQVFFGEVDGEEVFRVNGYRFFVHREETEWRVSDVRTGIMVSQSPFYDDAVKMAQKRIHDNYTKYLKALKNAPHAAWRF